MWLKSNIKPKVQNSKIKNAQIIPVKVAQYKKLRKNKTGKVKNENQKL